MVWNKQIKLYLRTGASSITKRQTIFMNYARVIAKLGLCFRTAWIAARNKNICKDLCQLCRYAMSYSDTRCHIPIRDVILNWNLYDQIILLFYRFPPLFPVWRFMNSDVSINLTYLLGFLPSLTYGNCNRFNRCVVYF